MRSYAMKLTRFIGIALVAILLGSCTEKPVHQSALLQYDQKIDSILKKMTLEEKIGQMTQVRHFSDIDSGDVRAKLIGSVIHTDGPAPGKDAAAWQQYDREAYYYEASGEVLYDYPMYQFPDIPDCTV